LQPAQAGASQEAYTHSEIQLITSLARAGRANAQFTLARMYLSGRNVEQDFEQGLQWLRKAAAQQHGQAQNQLGLLHLTGAGVSMDCGLAIHWFSQVGDKSDAHLQARSNLAWVLATCPSDAARDGQRALKIIQPLIKGKQRDNPSLLDTLAAALAETGQFEQAIAIQQQALALLEKQAAPGQRGERFNARLQSYRNHRPWRISAN
jgi:TPR repeat protein